MRSSDYLPSKFILCFYENERYIIVLPMPWSPKQSLAYNFSTKLCMNFKFCPSLHMHLPHPLNYVK